MMTNFHELSSFISVQEKGAKTLLLAEFFKREFFKRVYAYNMHLPIMVLNSANFFTAAFNNLTLEIII